LNEFAQVISRIYSQQFIKLYFNYEDFLVIEESQTLLSTLEKTDCFDKYRSNVSLLFSSTGI